MAQWVPFGTVQMYRRNVTLSPWFLCKGAKEQIPGSGTILSLLCHSPGGVSPCWALCLVVQRACGDVLGGELRRFHGEEWDKSFPGQDCTFFSRRLTLRLQGTTDQSINISPVGTQSTPAPPVQKECLISTLLFPSQSPVSRPNCAGAVSVQRPEWGD